MTYEDTFSWDAAGRAKWSGDKQIIDVEDREMSSPEKDGEEESEEASGETGSPGESEDETTGRGG